MNGSPYFGCAGSVVRPAANWARASPRRHQVEPDAAEMAERYGAETTVIDWHARLTCSGCGSRQVDFVVTGTERR